MTAAPLAAAEWKDLCASEDLSGWRIEGGQWSIQDGVIRGEAKPEEVGWLILEGQEFSNIAAEVEYRTPEATNGGLQLRGHWLPKTPLEAGKPLDSIPKIMYGYHVSIETRQPNCSGRLVEEGGRGILSEPAKDATQTEKMDGWNKLSVVAKGKELEVYLNGVKANSFSDETFIRGFFAIQVMGAAPGKDKGVIEHRNLRINDLGRLGDWQPLFDGKTLAGWKTWGEEEWVVENGAIVGRSGPKKSEGYLATEKQWTDFQVRGAFKMLGEGNYGLFYHSTITLRENDGYPMIAGVQGEIEPAYPSTTGWLYESYKRGWLVEPPKNTAAAVALRPTEWNEIEIRSKGSHATTWIYGVRALDFEDFAPLLQEGTFALQLHTGGVDGILWKDLYVQAPR